MQMCISVFSIYCPGYLKLCVKTIATTQYIKKKSQHSICFNVWHYFTWPTSVFRQIMMKCDMCWGQQFIHTHWVMVISTRAVHRPIFCGNPFSLDWFCWEKSTPQTVVFTIKYRGGSCKCSQKPIWSVVWNMNLIFPYIGLSSSQLTTSSFSEG